MRVQLHRKRMLRGDRDSPAAEQSPPRGPAPKRRHHPQDDPRDVDERETAIGRMVVRAGEGGEIVQECEPLEVGGWIWEYELCKDKGVVLK